MTEPYNDTFSRAVNAIMQAILDALPQEAAPDVRALARQCYSKLPLVDLKAMDAASEAARVLARHDFLRERLTGAPKLRVASENGRVVVDILNDDMPFLVDSVLAELARQGFSVLRLSHPIVTVARDAAGKLLAVAAPGQTLAGATHESMIQVELAGGVDAAQEAELRAQLLQVLTNVRFVVGDWEEMRARLERAIRDITDAPARFDAGEVTETRDFLVWLGERNFVLLGHVEYDFYENDVAGKGAAAPSLHVVPGSELGLFKSDNDAHRPKGLGGLPQEMLHFALIPQLVEISKSMRKSTVHRPVHMDYIGVKRFGENGKVIGERRFLGLFTSSVYHQAAGGIPVIRRKIARVLARANFDPASHDGKSLHAIIEFTPRDELFQFSDEELFEYAMGVLSLELRPTVRVFLRRDAFERYVSVIAFVPRERFGTSLREQMQAVLERVFAGQVSTYYIQMTDSPLVRVHFIVATTPGHIPVVDRQTLEAEIARVTYQWSEALMGALQEQWPDEAEALLPMFARAFPKAYLSEHDAAAALHDIQNIREVMRTNAPSFELFRGKEDDEARVHLKWYNPDTQIPLSDLLPVLENMGFKAIDEQPYHVRPHHAPLASVWIRDLTLSASPEQLAQFSALKPLLEETLARLWQNEMENDAFSGLVLRAGLHPREAVMLGAYAKYLRQVNFTHGPDAIAQTLARVPAITRLLVALFDARFNPVQGAEAEAKAQVILAAIENHLADVANINDDRIVKRLQDVMLATLRTNYYQTQASGAPKPYLSFKLGSALVPELPLPKPYAEIFVYSARMEGIHLRGGKVARGGLRWSDRPEDFRTEVLGLMKAQMVKNAVIVPVGSKGGFVLKRPPATREAFQAEGVACYKLFLSGLLDLTDNIVGGQVTPPAGLMRHDGDDPYLVVAADKGTASFSDYANAVSAEYGFWLGDAFASGGSVGYDHKKMAITARGAFISVARHFREMGHDIQAQDFTVIGIGDMSGDVFGNGMLLSRHIRLVAAFNHQHIFLDPASDAASSFKERERLFALPRSGWNDYDTSLISKGGGVFARSEKTIALSEEVRRLLGVLPARLTPDEVIRAILVAPVDLLWNGGIGTYVKAEDESHEQVGDRTNNALRVNGNQLRCKVIGEGGNLGLTQKGRIEYARAGGRINTDAIDNSAGVDCSDHEVNIKIGLGTLVASNGLTLGARDELLASMTEEVAELVLKDNRLQTQALTIAELQAPGLLEEHVRLMQAFERRGVLAREVEFLPGLKQTSERRAEQKGLTRPELAVLLAYSKMVLYGDLIASDLPDDAYFQRDLLRYFPAPMQQRFADSIANHPLKREIIATAVTNSIINRTGLTLIHAIAEDTGRHIADVARAYVAARDLFDLRALWADIEAQDGKMQVRAQTELFRAVTRFVAHITLWLLRNAPQPLDIAELDALFAAGIRDYVAGYDAVITPALAEKYAADVAELAQQDVPEALARQVARFVILAPALDIVRVSNESKTPLAEVGRLYFELGALLRLDALREQAQALPVPSHWDRLAAYALQSSVFDEQRRLSAHILSGGGLGAWQGAHKTDIERFTGFLDEIQTGSVISLPKLVIAIKKLGEIG